MKRTRTTRKSAMSDVRRERHSHTQDLCYRNLGDTVSAMERRNRSCVVIINGDAIIMKAERQSTVVVIIKGAALAIMVS